MQASRSSLLVLAAAFLFAAPAAAQTTVTVKLSSAVNVPSARAGDAVSGTVTAPAQLAGDAVTGHVVNAIGGKNQASVQIAFDSLRHGGSAMPITSTVTGVANAQGQPDRDDWGTAVSVGEAPAPQKKGGFGGLSSGLNRLSGATGHGGTAADAASAADDASNSAAPSSSAGVFLNAKAARLALGQGASVTIQASAQDGSDLAALAPSSGAATTVANASASAGQSSAAGSQPEMKATKIEFVPGERTVFFDDFSDMAADEPPPHWKVRDGHVELRTGGGIREIALSDGTSLTSPHINFPANFTFQLDWSGTGEMEWELRNKADEAIIQFVVRGEEDGQQVNTSMDAHGEHLADGTMFPTDTSKIVHFALWAQQGRVRMYVNGERVADVNQVDFSGIDHLWVQGSRYRPTQIASVRVAESAPDFGSAMASSGKFVTHGIYFDTDSATLKPESAAVLQQVAAGLAKNPALHVEIDGFTDSVGVAAHNLDLSKRRADAVKNVLVKQFGVDAGRLSSNGFGADKPVSSNDTAQGRADNRRVEFVKK